jgi:hypothetical protein
MKCMDASQGDTRVFWDPKKPVEVDAARRAFEHLLANGYCAYQMEQGDKRGKLVREFCPDAQEIIMCAPLAGG